MRLAHATSMSCSKCPAKVSKGGDYPAPKPAAENPPAKSPPGLKFGPAYQ